MFLIDKYTPKSIDEVTFHRELYELLESFSRDESIPHLIFYGPEGSGKRTLIKIFLEMLFDETINDTTDVAYNVVGSGNKPSDEIIKQSNYHIVLEPKGTNFDRYLIHDVVKLYAKRLSLGIFKTKRPFKLVLINNADNLSNNAQYSLRRTMEIYSDKCRFIMWCKSLSKIIKPLRSRCKCLSVPAPNDDELMLYTLCIAKRENINVSVTKFNHIVTMSDGNIKSALWYLELYKNNRIIMDALFRGIDMIQGIFERYGEKYNKLNDIKKEIEIAERKCIFIEKADRIYLDLQKYVFDGLYAIMKRFDIDTEFKCLSSLNDFLTEYDKKNKHIKKAISNSKLPKSNKFDEDLDTIHVKLSNFQNYFDALDTGTDYQRVINKIVNMICYDKDLSNFPEMRNHIFNLMITNINGTRILTDITDGLMSKSDISNTQKMEIMKMVANIDHNLIKGRREIIHFDVLITSVMAILRR